MGKVVGFIGIGNMGKPMAENLLKAGWEVVVSGDRNNEAVAAYLKEAGARVVPTVGEIPKGADIIITVLPADAQILSVYCDEGGVIDTAPDGALCIEMTSARGETVRRIAQTASERGKRLTFVDAPVSGGVVGAQGGSLTIMVGCEKVDYDRALPVMEAMGKKLFYTGGLGSGKDIKMLNQLLNAGNTIVASEVIFLARHLGVDLDLLSNVVNESSGGSWVFKNNVAKHVIPQMFEGGFRMDLMKKDVSLSAEQIARDHLSMPVTTLIYQIFESISNMGYAATNYCAVSKWVENLNSVPENSKD